MKMDANIMHVGIVIAIMIGGGSLGGIASYLSSSISKGEERPLLKRVVLGIAAAVVVPLLLSMISSSILSDDSKLMNYFTFASFCVVAGFSSKAFLTSISKRIIERIETVEDRQSELEEEVDPLLVKETEPALEGSSAQFRFYVNDEELQVLKA